MHLDADYHVHSNYSDGSFLEWMVRAGAEAGLSAIGIADHCMITETADHQLHRDVAGYNLDQTYPRRRRAIEAVADAVGIEVYDAVEVDFFPGEIDRIERFLAEADFAYTIGSVHTIDGVNVHFSEHFAGLDGDRRRELVDAYFDDLETLIRSELFDIAAHPDIIERNEALRGIADESQYRRIAAAFEGSSTIPELNAGRIDAEYGRFHPNEPFLQVLLEHDVPITIGSDSHEPDAIGPRLARLAEAVQAHGIEPASPFDG